MLPKQCKNSEELSRTGICKETVIWIKILESKLNYPDCAGSGECCFLNNLVVRVTEWAMPSVLFTPDSSTQENVQYNKLNNKSKLDKLQIFLSELELYFRDLES